MTTSKFTVIAAASVALLSGCASTGRIDPYWTCPKGDCNPNGAGWPVVAVNSPPGGRMELTDIAGKRILIYRHIPIHLARCAEEHGQLHAAGWRHSNDTLVDGARDTGVLVCSLDGFSLNVVQR